jgi:hypothetical protein
MDEQDGTFFVNVTGSPTRPTHTKEEDEQEE